MVMMMMMMMMIDEDGDDDDDDDDDDDGDDGDNVPRPGAATHPPFPGSLSISPLSPPALLLDALHHLEASCLSVAAVVIAGYHHPADRPFR